MARKRPAWLDFRRFAAFTTGLTLTLVMLGIYTAATASGLACSAQWPLCDGGVLPQTVPSFIEWFHRLVAMVTGLFIAGTAAWAWRTDDRYGRYAATAAVVLLPLQIGVGAVTVTIGGLVPGGYTPSTQGAHFAIAVSIFTALVFTTLRAFAGTFERDATARVRHALLAAALAFPVVAVLGRGVPLLSYSPAAQAAHYGTALAVYAATLAATVWARDTRHSGLRYATGAALVGLLTTMLLGRDLVVYTPAVRLFDVGVVAAVAAVLVGATLVVYRRGERRGRPDVTVD
jgi:cytochrome c oxidase assembly protein subunit 15